MMVFIVESHQITDTYSSLLIRLNYLCWKDKWLKIILQDRDLEPTLIIRILKLPQNPVACNGLSTLLQLIWVLEHCIEILHIAYLWWISHLYWPLGIVNAITTHVLIRTKTSSDHLNNQRICFSPNQRDVIRCCVRNGYLLKLLSAL